MSTLPARTEPFQHVTVDQTACITCGRCIQICPMDVFQPGADRKPVVAYDDDCSMCMLCVTDCPTDCITVSLTMRSNFVSIYDHLGIVTVPFAGELPASEPPSALALQDRPEPAVQGPEAGADWSESDEDEN